ncbi:MAG: Ig-like domain-containing protein, partial [Candidatus Paceibacterota bacterium]
MIAIAQKAVTVSVTLATIMWSAGLPFMFPQAVLAAGLTAISGAGGPPNGQIGAPVEAMVDQTFSEPLNEATVNTTNVILKAAGGGESAGDQTGDNLCTSVSVQGGNRIICNHAVALTKDVWYTFTVTTGVEGLSAATLSSNFVSSFKTGSFGGGTQFNPPPFVTGSIPNGGSSLPVNGKIIINFSSVMKSDGAGSVLNADNIGLYLVTNGAPSATNLLTDDKLSWNASNKQLKITPPTLTAGNNYRVKIFSDNNGNPSDNSCGGAPNPTIPCVMNTDGLAFMGQPFMIDFNAVAADVTPPAATGSFPNTAATDVDRAQVDFSISFNKSLDPATVATTTVELYRDVNEDGAVDGGDALINGTTVALDPDGRVIHLSSNQILAANTKYIIRVKGEASGVADTLGNTASGDLSIRTFTTGNVINGAVADTIAPRVMFASADNFSIAVTFSEAMKFNATSSVAQATSAGANDANNLSNWTLETAPTGNVTNWMQTPLTGKQVSYEPYRKTLMIMNLAMPPGGNFRLTAATTTQDLSSNGIDAAANKAQGTVKSSQDTGGMLGPGQSAGPVNFFNMGMKPINVSPMSAMAGATSRYRVEFPADQAIAASGVITLSFPTGFTFTGDCNTLPTDNFENADINGPAPGTVSVASIACSSVSGTATITLGSTGIQTGDMVRFGMQGVVNSTVPKDFSSSGYTVDIKTYNASNMLLESKTSMPFFITAPGARTITGTVFNDNGAGGGTANDGVKNGTEAGVAGISVCMGGGGTGLQCENTAGDGTYDFTGLNNGFYHVEIPPITSGAYTGGPFFRDLNINGSNVVENFGVKQASAENILDVYISGSGLDGTKLDVFAFSSAGSMNMGSNSGPGGSVVRECMIGGGADWTNCNAVSLPLAQGKWQVGVGPWMPKGQGGANSMPDFNFMPPRSIEVEVGASGVPDLCATGAGAAKYLCFDLASASNQIKGKVTDGAGAAIQNAFVGARPAFMNDANGPANGGGGQSDSAGLFTVKVVTGTYLVDASMPGMPPSNSTECTVKANTGADDGNAAADVYCNGSLVTIANPLIFKLAKGGTSISGRVLDDANNPISFAHVQGMEVNDS